MGFSAIHIVREFHAEEVPVEVKDIFQRLLMANRLTDFLASLLFAVPLLV